MEQIISVLIKRGEELLAQRYEGVQFAANSEADELLSDMTHYPHAFVLGCVMDRQMKAERAWSIPYEVSKEIGGFEFARCYSVDLDTIKEIFTRRKLHRFRDTMAQNFFQATQRIHKKYSDDASNIWKGRPKSATVVRRFLEFKGVGIKIASMAGNLLARDFKIPMEDKLCLDISPDVQVRRAFIRLGLLEEGATRDQLIYRARELNPEYPGVFDVGAWEIGRKWCRPRNPDCEGCYLETLCPKVGAGRKVT